MKTKTGITGAFAKLPFLFIAHTLRNQSCNDHCHGDTLKVPQGTLGRVLRVDRKRALLQFAYPQTCYGWADVQELEISR